MSLNEVGRFPPAISEDDNIIIHLVPLEQPLPVETPPPEESEPQDLPSSPAANDETQISGEGHQEQAFQSPAGETQATGPNEVSGTPQETAVWRVPLHTVVRRVRADEEFQDRRARRGELIARTIIKDSRQEGRLNCVLARRQHQSLLRALRNDSITLESLARTLRKDSASAAQHRHQLYSYLDRLIVAGKESVVQKCHRNDIMERHLASNNSSSTQAVSILGTNKWMKRYLHDIGI
ncbi:hypothetical protein JD844_024958 [Phrynosoma platyrhinos]|uniref:Uncharacterized protein n=1 Tax=Phrynosoma platyrhinos TaxID=52577 RepID=A0ABQ7SYM8_PHRPL|nr:hypothetical protein JD844_024958 [Phrynosoma platyrhinos]